MCSINISTWNWVIFATCFITLIPVYCTTILTKIYLTKLANYKKLPKLVFTKWTKYRVHPPPPPPRFFQYYRQIKSSPNCDIFKTAKYKSQHFSFYSTPYSSIFGNMPKFMFCLIYWSSPKILLLVFWWQWFKSNSIPSYIQECIYI